MHCDFVSTKIINRFFIESNSTLSSQLNDFIDFINNSIPMNVHYGMAGVLACIENETISHCSVSGGDRINYIHNASNLEHMSCSKFQSTLISSKQSGTLQLEVQCTQVENG